MGRKRTEYKLHVDYDPNIVDIYYIFVKYHYRKKIRKKYIKMTRVITLGSGIMAICFLFYTYISLIFFG